MFSQNKKQLLKFIIPILIVLVVSIAGLLSYTISNNKSTALKLNNNTSGKNILNSDEDVINAVKKLMLLPDETPTIITINDLTKYQGQPFFAKAAVGDKVLVFMNSKKAILYSPSDNLIIEVGAINNQTAGQVAGSNTNNVIPTQMPSPLPTPSDFSTEY